MAGMGRVGILIDVSRASQCRGDRRDRAMNAYATQLLVRDHQASLEAEAARERRRREIPSRPAGEGLASRIAARVRTLGRERRTARPAAEARAL
jgi:hypothetical protein